LNQGETELESIVAADPSPEAVLITKADRSAVRQALQELPMPFREVLLLCEVEEMGYEEIAQVLAIPIGTVMSRLHRARKALRARLVERATGGPHGV
jgi:RNA polymerase sigma-70 factor (ECF subfamily)